jgi:hypothetical protein
VKEIIVREVYKSMHVSQGNKQPCKHEPRDTLDIQTDIEGTRHVEKNRHLEHIVETTGRYGNPFWNFLTLHQLEILDFDITTSEAGKSCSRGDKADNKRQ